MKKLSIISATLITAGILFTGTNSANAQSKLSFGLNVGYTAPSGGFSSTDGSKEPVVTYPSRDTANIAGYATGGFHFNVYGTYMFSTQVGAMLSIGGSMNGYNIAAVNSNIVASYTSSGNIGVVPALTASGGYYVGEYLVGPYICLSASDKLKIELKGLVGLTSLNYPTLSFSESASGLTYNYSLAVKSASGFGYNIGAGVEYMLSDMLGLHFNLAYAGTSASYPSYTATETSGGSSVTQTHNTPLAMSVGMIQATVGISVSL